MPDTRTLSIAEPALTMAGNVQNSRATCRTFRQTHFRSVLVDSGIDNTIDEFLVGTSPGLQLLGVQVRRSSEQLFSVARWASVPLVCTLAGRAVEEVGAQRWGYTS